jgi:hypothetical protein
VDLRRHTVSLLRLRPSSVLRSVELRPHGRLETHRARRLLTSALPWRCFPVVRHHLEHPRPTAHPSVPPFAKSISQTTPPPPCQERICGYSIAKKHIGRAKREISMLVYGYFNFQNPPYMASRQLLISRIAGAGSSFSPLACQAWYGYGVASAQRVEVEVGADGHASAPPSGAAAVAPLAGACPCPPNGWI